MPLKHRANVAIPDISGLKDSATRTAFDQFLRLFRDTSVNIYDDLSAVSRDKVLYFGDEGTDGTWRILATSTRFSFQLRESGVWNEKLFASA